MKQQGFYHNRFRYLDVIRAFAALSILLAHLSREDQLTWLFRNTFWANGGLHAGVITFVVLSGFVIHLLHPPLSLLPPANTYSVSNKTFWGKYMIRRFSRILPVFFFGCFLGVMSLYFGHEPVNPFLSVIYGLSFIYPWVPLGAPVGNEILCIVQVLCWIYVAYPLVCFGKMRGGWKLVLGFAALLYTVAMCMAYLGVDPTWAGRSFYALFIYWVLGAISAEYYIKHGNFINLKWGGLLLVISFFLYVGFCHYINIKGSHYIKSLMFALWNAVFLFHVMSAESKKQREYNWLTKAMAFIGEMSYSLYVVHFPILAITSLFIAQYSIGTSLMIGRLITVVLVFTVTYFTYRFIELPSHRLAKKISL